MVRDAPSALLTMRADKRISQLPKIKAPPERAALMF
jgi:hypothetical protein